MSYFATATITDVVCISPGQDEPGFDAARARYKVTARVGDSAEFHWLTDREIAKLYYVGREVTVTITP